MRIGESRIFLVSQKWRDRQAGRRDLAVDRKSEIAENLAKVRQSIPAEVNLIVVTKTFPASYVEILKQLGVNDFGENKDQEGRAKSAIVPGKWHFQGQIQSNKLKSICNWADTIHSIDEIRHVEMLKKFGKALEVFIQVSLDGGENRGGCDPEQLNSIAEVVRDSNLELMGLMAVAPLNEPPEQAFARLSVIHKKFQEKYPDSPYLSAGMSHDYEVAIRHGATHVRIGSKILGSRTYPN